MFISELRLLKVLLLAELVCLFYPSLVRAGPPEAVATVIPVPLIGHPGGISVAYSANSRIMVSGGADNSLKVWDVATRRLLRSLECHDAPRDGYYGRGEGPRVIAVAVSADGLTALSGGRDGAICVWDTASGLLRLKIAAHAHDIKQLYLTPDTNTIVSVGDGGDVASDDVVRFWSAGSGAAMGSAPGDGASVTVTPNGRAVMVAHHTTAATLYEIPTGRVIGTIEAARNAVHAAFQTDATTLLTVQFDDQTRPSLRRIDVASGRVLAVTTVAGLGADRDILALGADDRMVVDFADRSKNEYSPDHVLEIWSTKGAPVRTAVLPRTFTPDTVAFVPAAGGLVTTAGRAIEVWDVASGARLVEFAGSAPTTAVDISPDGHWIVSSRSGASSAAILWDTISGRRERVLGAVKSPAESDSSDPSEQSTDTTTQAVFGPGNGNVFVRDDADTLRIWDNVDQNWHHPANGRDGKAISTLSRPWIVTYLADERAITVIEASTAQVYRTLPLPKDAGSPREAIVSKTGRYALVLTQREPDVDGDLLVFDLANNRQLRRIEKIGPSRPWSADFSADEKYIVMANSKRGNNVVQVREIVSNALVHEFHIDKTTHDVPSEPDADGSVEGLAHVEFSPGGKYLSVTTHWTNRWGERIIRTQDWSRIAFHFHSGWAQQRRTYLDDDKRVLITTGWSQRVDQQALADSPDPERKPLNVLKVTGPAGMAYDAARGRIAITDGKVIRLLSIEDGRVLATLNGHLANVTALKFTPDGRRLASGSEDGTVRLWDLATNALIVTFLGRQDGEWITITPEGFFAGSPRAGELLSVVRGLEAISIDQLWQSLFNPDLVREKIAGDPSGEVAKAAKVLGLEEVVASGSPPAVSLGPLQPGNVDADGLVSVEAKVSDASGGVGRIEWRVNGITAAVTTSAATGGATAQIAQRLALDPGDNTIEVVAYNVRNLLASLPARTTATYTASGGAPKPKLHVLAIGINAYHDAGWLPPDDTARHYFPPLKLAVADARSIADAFEKSGQGLYAEVHVTLALDADATAENLDRIIARISDEISPRDTFVFYAAAHGYSIAGRFYLIPEDHQGGEEPAALARDAIDQSRLQNWLANRIKAKRAVIILDTCESGALVGGYTRSRADLPASEAALGRLNEATGRPVLTAAAEGRPAFEGVNGHGVFTWVLLDALRNGDRNKNGTIELSEIVLHVQDQVPKVSAKLKGRGRAETATAVPTVQQQWQSPHFGTRGEDFALVRRLP